MLSLAIMKSGGGSTVTLQLLLMAVVLLSAVSGQQCQSVLIPPVYQDDFNVISCHPLQDCNGASCTNTQLQSVITTFTVDNCQDPVLVNLTMTNTDDGSLVLTHVFNETTFFSSNYQIHWNMHRNASHLFIHSVLGGSQLTLVPQTIVNLNASDCMCQSIQSIADNGESPVETNCVNNTQCTGLECTLNVPVPIGSLRIETEVQPCSIPPGFIFIVRHIGTNTILYDQFFTSSRNTTLNIAPGLSVPLDVTIEHRNYSMIISVNIVVVGSVYHLVPPSQIILDKTGCSSFRPTTTSINLQPTPTTTPVIMDPDTCNSLKSVARQSSQCSTNQACDTLQCNAIGYRSFFTVLPCNNPPGFHVSIYNSDNVTIYDGTVTNTTTVPLSTGLGIYLIILVTHNQSDAIGIQVQLQTQIGTNDLVPKTEIPYNPCQCPSNYSCTPPPVTHSRTHATPHNSHGRPVSGTGVSSVTISVVPPAKSHKLSETATVGIGASVGFVVLVAMVIVSAIAVLLIVKRCRAAHRGFNRLSVQSDDDNVKFIGSSNNDDL